MKQLSEAPVRKVFVLESCLQNYSLTLWSTELIVVIKGVSGRTFTSSASVGENGGVESGLGGEVFSDWYKISLVRSGLEDV